MKRQHLITCAAFLLVFYTNANAADRKSNTSDESANTPFSIGVGVKASTLGIGGDVAVSLTRRTNARAGFNVFNYNRRFSSNGIDYNGQLALRSAQAQLDFFPFGGGFHLSPGLMFYNGNNLNANSSVPPGQTFNLNNTAFRSSPTDPLTGTGKMSLNRVGPMFTLGWGNLVPRKAGKHFSFSFEGGFVYQGTPDVKLDFNGSACNANGTNCQKVATFTQFQTSLIQEQNRLNDKASPFRFYPIVSTGVGYRF